MRITPTLSLPLKMALARSRISTPKLKPSINLTFLSNFQAKGKGFFYRSLLSSINIIICSNPTNPHSKANTKTESELSPPPPSNIPPPPHQPQPSAPSQGYDYGYPGTDFHSTFVIICITWAIIGFIAGLAIAVGLINCWYLRFATQRSNKTSHAPMHLQHLITPPPQPHHDQPQPSAPSQGYDYGYPNTDFHSQFMIIYAIIGGLAIADLIWLICCLLWFATHGYI